MVHSMGGLAWKRNEQRTESFPTRCFDVWADDPEEQKERMQTRRGRSRLLRG